MRRPARDNKFSRLVQLKDCIAWGFSGVMVRGSGGAWDLRKSQPYECYAELDFDIPVGKNGDCFDRYLIRMEEMRQSVKIMKQCIERLNAPEGEQRLLRRLRAPGVLVGGTFDLLASSADMRSVAKRIPGWRYVEICGSHSLPIEQPAAVHRELLAFLVELEAGP